MTILEQAVQEFEWDEHKANLNLSKHGISFAEALPIFFDDGILIEEDRMVDGELRWTAIGKVRSATILIVAHTVRQEGFDEVVRIISARKANAKERRRYGQHRSKDI